MEAQYAQCCQDKIILPILAVYYHGKTDVIR
jgi:hypothetical protein